MKAPLGFLSSVFGQSSQWPLPREQRHQLLRPAFCSFIPFHHHKLSRRRHQVAQQLGSHNKHDSVLLSAIDESYQNPDNAKEQATEKQTHIENNAIDRSQQKWSEITFDDIQDELSAIDEYEKEEELQPDDPWPKFLRGAAYEYWGQPRLALAQYALTKHAAGLRKVPTLWERRAYNSFKMGEVIAANAYFDVASAIHKDAGGNELHFSHWFNDTFASFVPKVNGPSATLQHAICKYSAGELKEAVQLLVSQVAIMSEDTQHALLWFLASSFRLTSEKVIENSDVNLCNSALRADIDWNERLARLALLFTSAAQNLEEKQAAVYAQMVACVEADLPHVDITTNTYLALYHDAFTGDMEQRDVFLDKVCSLTSTASPHDIENFLYHASKIRLTIPPGARMDDIPELV